MTTSGAASLEAAAARRPETMSGHVRPTAYYDGACPLCVREIEFYRRQDGADRICWVDISGIDTMDVARDLSRQHALAQFTVRDADGSLVSGSRAFTLIWKHLPRFRWLATIFDIQPFAWLLGQAYSVFLELRPRLQAMALSREVRKPRG